MKILFISRTLGFYFGGAENYEVSLAHILKKHGHEVNFLAGVPIFKKAENLNDLNDFKILRCKTLFFKNTAQKLFHFNDKMGLLFFNLDNYIFKKIILKKYKKIFTKDQYDLFQITGQIDLAHSIKKISKGKVSVFFPGILDINKIDKILKVDGVFSDGYSYNLLKEIHPNVSIIHGGIRQNIYFSKYEREQKRRKYLSEKNEKIILMVNRLVFLKNIKLAIDIAKILNDNRENFKLIIIGEGPDKNRLQKYITKFNLGKKVMLMGFIPPKYLFSYYSAADIFLLTSQFDNFPNVIKEAMKIGLPIIASNNSGIKMLVKDGENGFLCNNKNDFTNKISFLFLNPQISKKISEKNIKKAEKLFNWETSYNKYINYINNL
ncbi:MAG: glycosyltransferase family 4 protein [Enterobacteriaceae bacterium]|nr:glycosyltransferase family 4 protein [Enterobacteriaceae bacterium]